MKQPRDTLKPSQETEAVPPSPPAPEAAPCDGLAPPKSPARLSPTRYGDWVRGGRCIDF